MAFFTESLFDEGVDIFMGVGGLIGSPGFDVARERGGYGIWVDVDGYNLLPEARDVMLTSVLKNMDNSVFDVISATRDGSFQGCGVYVGALEKITNYIGGCPLDAVGIQLKVRQPSWTCPAVIYNSVKRIQP